MKACDFCGRSDRKIRSVWIKVDEVFTNGTLQAAYTNGLDLCDYEGDNLSCCWSKFFNMVNVGINQLRKEVDK